MRLNDTAAGALAMLAGLAVVIHTRSFPPMPGQPIGPALFPAVIGCALFIAGALLIVTGRTKRAALVSADAWMRRPRMALSFALVIAMLLFYALVLHRLGFFLTAFLFLAVLFVAFGVPRRWILPLAAGIVFLIHYGFYTLLRVPLPWGVLEGLAW